MFKPYPKIHRLGKEETDGILDGVCHIEEKIDGANVSIWQEGGEIQLGSRTRHLPKDESFNGFREWVEQNKDRLTSFFLEHPDARMYGEWLVRHTIQYDETAYKQFYLFDVFVGDEHMFSRDYVHRVADKYGLKTPKYHGAFENPNVEQLMQFVGKSELGDVGEGIVIKNHDFVDKFGNRHYAKIVTEKFKEENATTFGGNNKHSDTYWEVYIVNKYMTLARIQKIINKLQPLVDKRLDLEHTPRIIQTAYHDMLTEEIWDIAKKVGSVDFKALQRISMKKAAQVYKDIINNSISIADS